MKYYYIILKFLEWLFFISIIRLCSCQSSNKENNGNNEFKPTKFSMDVFDINGDFTTRIHLNYDYENFEFKESQYLFYLTNISYAIVCCDDDLYKIKKNTMIFWNTSTYESFSSSSHYLKAFPLWYIKQKEKGNEFCMRIDSVGWNDNANSKICKDETTPCPDIIIMGNSQLTYRYYKKETISLNKYYQNYLKKTGNFLEDLFDKYVYYDYFVNNNWLGVPLSADLRILVFNMTTFDYCMNKKYDLHYPPPFSDYWGSDYTKTWTWKKVFEYAGMITECTGIPGFKLLPSNNEDLKFFVNLCQSLNIPFLKEDTWTNIKKCGLRNKEYINRLSILKDLTENHYINMWLNITDVNKWKNSPYPDSLEKQPIISYDNNKVLHDHYSVNGFYYTTIYEILNFSNYPKIKYIHMPGTSTCFYGSGAVITNKPEFRDEMFEFLEILIDQKYPFFKELNVSVTPFQNTRGAICSIDNKTLKDYNCRNLLKSEGIYPYYYIYNNMTYFINLTHISTNSTYGFIINSDDNPSIQLKENPITDKLKNIFDTNFFCSDEVNFEKRLMSYYGKYKIEIPISTNETLILKSTIDIEKHKIVQSTEMICTLLDENKKYSKPLQFPYNNFIELSNLERRAPISLLFAHLYYRHNGTSDNSLEKIINEICDIIDDALMPDCNLENINNNNNDNKKVILSKCHENNQTMTINYLNCKTNENGNNEYKKEIQCFYLPHTSIGGLAVTITPFVLMIIEAVLYAITFINRDNKYITTSGLKYITFITYFSFILHYSTYYWIGPLKKRKCIVRIWLMIFGISGFICSYTIRSNYILSIYNNSTLKNTSYYKKIKMYFAILFIIIVLLTIWTIPHDGIETKKYFLIMEDIMIIIFVLKEM